MALFMNKNVQSLLTYLHKSFTLERMAETCHRTPHHVFCLMFGSRLAVPCLYADLEILFALSLDGYEEQHGIKIYKDDINELP